MSPHFCAFYMHVYLCYPFYPVMYSQNLFSPAFILAFYEDFLKTYSHITSENRSSLHSPRSLHLLFYYHSSNQLLPSIM